MFVVKRPFRNLGKTLTAGTVITEPAAIKRFNGRVAEGKIIEVTEQTYNNIAKYFKSKYGVTLPPFAETSNLEVHQEPDSSQELEVKQEPKEVKPKVAVKASVTPKA